MLGHCATAYASGKSLLKRCTRNSYSWWIIGGQSRVPNCIQPDRGGSEEGRTTIRSGSGWGNSRWRMGKGIKCSRLIMVN